MSVIPTPMKYFWINRAVLNDSIKFELMIDDNGKMFKVDRLFDTAEEAQAEGMRQCPPVPAQPGTPLGER